MNLHPELLAAVERRFADRLAAPPRLTQDALNLSLANGAVLSVRYAAPDAYSLRWRVGPAADAAELGIDTAPTHPQLATFPRHLHLADGSVVADPLTRLDASAEDNLAAVIEAILSDPQLETVARC